MYTLRDTKINAHLIAFLVFMFAFRDHAASEVSCRFPSFYYGISATTNKTEKYTCQHAHVRLHKHTKMFEGGRVFLSTLLSH